MVKLDDTWLLLHSTLWNSFTSDDEQAEKGIAAAVHRLEVGDGAVALHVREAHLQHRLGGWDR